MTKPMTVSDRAFAALRKEKKKGESDSDVIMRLLEEAKGRKKDPWLWVNMKHKRSMSLDEHLKMIEESREADRRDPWEEAEKRDRDERRRGTRA